MKINSPSDLRRKQERWAKAREGEWKPEWWILIFVLALVAAVVARAL
jgi:hypothetical protein